MRINLVYCDNLAGLSKDALIVGQVLEATGATVTRSNMFQWNRWQRKIIQYLGPMIPSRYDVNIFLEHVEPAWLPFARSNVLIPNPEWFETAWIDDLPRFDGVFCKSHDAVRRFASVGAAAQYVGFTSRDRRLCQPLPEQEGVLHVAGQSLQKGTASLVRVWLQHPEWPLLTVIWRESSAKNPLPQISAPNILVRGDYLPDGELQRLQNSLRLHACPSEAEGFGHSLVESMSCGAVLITTDAPPMNELVQPGRGLLVAVVSSTPRLLGDGHSVNDQSLDRSIAEALSMSEEQRDRMGAAARQWFLENDRAFRQNFIEAINTILEGKRRVS